jgi:deazaflavin-dependent oxidoreductase (nitroreductase family)
MSPADNVSAGHNREDAMLTRGRRMTLATRIVLLLLRSPLHRLVGDRVMLLAVSGRRSGRRYSLPVRYAVDDRTLVVVAEADRTTWWLNLLRQAPVDVRMDGRRRHGIAHLVWDADEADRALAAYARTFPEVLPPSDRPIDPSAIPGGRLALTTLAPPRRDHVVVRIQLTADLG